MSPREENKIRRAAELMSGDWDAEGETSAHVPTGVAVDFLHRKGWYQFGGQWRLKTRDGVVSYWSTEEAFTIAIVAESL